MERITYRITLDAHRNGIQRTLQGFETADKMSRRISIGLVAGSDTYELPMTNVVAMMYVTTPSAKQPSINECVIDGNTIIYDVEPIVEEGITEMQLKVMGTSTGGATSVLISPRFAIEVTNSGASDSNAQQTTTFTALESAISRADAVYNARLLRVVIEENCVFKAYYADGTVYENDYFREAMYNGNALLSQSYAVGGSGVRSGEDTDNSKYYSNVSRSASEDATRVYEDSHELMKETQLQANYTHFELNFETGNLGYISTYADFNVNKHTGQLEISKDPTYTPEDVILSNATGVVEEVIASYSGRVEENKNAIAENKNSIQENANAIQSNANAIQTNANNISANTQAIRENATAIANHKDLIEDNTSAIQTNATNIQNLSDNMEMNYATTEHVYRNFVGYNDAEENYLKKNKFEFCEMTFTNIKASEFGTVDCYMDYPGGFNQDNCIVVGVMTKDVLFTTWLTVFFTLGVPASVKALNPTVSLMSDGIKLTFGLTANGTKDSIGVRILLYKFGY